MEATTGSSTDHSRGCGGVGNGTTDYYLPGLANKPGESAQTGGTQYLTVDREGKLIVGTAVVPPDVEIIAPDFNCTTTGDGAVCFGKDAQAEGKFSSAFGSNATANGVAASAFGTNATATSVPSYRRFCERQARMSLPLRPWHATGISSLAIGEEAQAIGDRSFALGYRQRSSERCSGPRQWCLRESPKSAALGQGVETTRIGQVAPGSSTAEITIANLATQSTANNGSQYNMVVANGDGTLSGLKMEGASIDGNTLTFTSHKSVTQAGPVENPDPAKTATSSGITVTSNYDEASSTTTYGVQVATGDNIRINDQGKVSGLKTTVSAADRKVLVTETGGFDQDNNFTTSYEIGVNITDRAFDALNCTGSGDGAECYGNGAVANQVASTAIGSTAQSTPLVPQAWAMLPHQGPMPWLSDVAPRQAMTPQRPLVQAPRPQRHRESPLERRPARTRPQASPLLRATSA